MLRFPVLNCIILVIAVGVRASKINIRAWQSAEAFPSKNDFPETEMLKEKPSTAIGFTGGGSRAYVAAIGQLAALTEMGLMSNIRYIGGISGGAWATLTFTYAQNVKSDEIFLGKILPPDQLTKHGLEVMDPACARSFASRNLTLIALNAVLDGKVHSLPDSWAYAVQEVYLDPVAIPRATPYSWNHQIVAEIKKRNLENLKDIEFIFPANTDRPYPIVGSSLVGPVEGGPYGSKTQNYTLIEFTPLYAGQFRKLEVTYNYHDGIKHHRTVGGAIEPVGFSKVATSGARMGLKQGATTGILSVEHIDDDTDAWLDLRYTAGASSYAPGALVESFPLDLSKKMGYVMDYWSPTNLLPEGGSYFYADGGSYENIPLISYLQRRVEKIVLFINCEAPLQPASAWNVSTDVFEDQMTDNLSSFFGVLPASMPNWENKSYEYDRNQVFSRSDFDVLVNSLQAAQARGNGIVATLNLVTVANDWWGIPAGVSAEVTFVYLGRVSGWEAKLSKEMNELLVPHDAVAAADLSQDIEHGPFRKFPHYPTTGGEISFERANVLADLTGWTVLQNADLFRNILS